MSKISVETGSLGRISFYNATDVAKEHRGWAFGTFVTDEAGAPLTNAFEVKWMQYKVGDKRDVWAEPTTGITFHIVLTGEHRQVFAPNGIGEKPVEHILRSGDACFFDNSIPHKWITEKDGEGITIRRLHD